MTLRQANRYCQNRIVNQKRVVYVNFTNRKVITDVKKVGDLVKGMAFEFLISLIRVKAFCVVYMMYIHIDFQ